MQSYVCFYQLSNNESSDLDERFFNLAHRPQLCCTDFPLKRGYQEEQLKTKPVRKAANTIVQNHRTLEEPLPLIGRRGLCFSSEK